LDFPWLGKCCILVYLDLYIYFGFPLARLKWSILLKSVRLPLHFHCHCTNLIHTLCFVGRSNNFSTPTPLCMLVHISCRLRITCIEESPNPPQFMSTALGGAHKGVAVAALNIINDRSGPEEGVDGCGPILSKSFC
jgi:hypothetical protein